MDCHEFDKRLEQYLSGSPMGVAWVEARAHWQSCAACQSRHEYAHDLIAAPPRTPDDEDDFVHDVLTRTSGNACGRAESFIDAYIDGDLPAGDAELVGGHLQHCRPCQQLVVALSEIKTPLREMAFIDPGPEFAQTVVEATVGAGIRQVAPAAAPATAPDRRREGVPFVDRFLHRLRETWQGLIARPGFALEAAYAATLILVLAFGARGTSWNEVPGKTARLAEANPVNGVVALVQSVPWQQGLAVLDPITNRVTNSRVVSWPRERGGEAAVRWQLASEAAGDLVDHGAEFGKALWQKDEAQAGQQLQLMTDNIAELREAFVGELSPATPDTTGGTSEPADIDAQELTPPDLDPGNEDAS